MDEKNMPQLDSEAKTGRETESQKQGWAFDFYSWLQALTFALIAIIIVFTFFGRIVGVDGSSMVPTLTDGDMLLIQCFGYKPVQGDVVVVHKDFPGHNDPIVKRVIATGGQHVHIDYISGVVYVDGESLSEPYLGKTMVKPGSPTMQNTDWDVPENSIFVLGDNRNNSTDSREDSLGTIDSRYILGRARLVFFPFCHFGSIQ